MTANLASIFNQVGIQLGIRVAPVGLAFARSRVARPDLKVCVEDGHPTSYGTYLAAGVPYAAIYGVSPVGNRFVDWSIPPESKAFLQKIAAQTIGN